MFALKEVEQVVGKSKIYKLVVDGICQFDSFCEEVEKNGNMKKDLVAAYRILTQVCNGDRLPNEKYHPLKDRKNQFEVKKNSLRIYLIKDSNGHIIILGSVKNNQKTDLNKIDNLHKKYLDSL